MEKIDKSTTDIAPSSRDIAESKRIRLITLSKEKGFKSKIILFDGDGSTMSDTKYYLWMQELRLWLLESGLDCFGTAGTHLKEWMSYVDHDTILNFETVYSDSNKFYDTLPLALEKALTEGLKLTEK